MVAREPAEGDSAGDIGTRAPIERSRACLFSLRAALASAWGLLRELSLGPFAPEARIMPLDQAANDDVPETETT